jgi:hypothetical protein
MGERSAKPLFTGSTPVRASNTLRPTTTIQRQLLSSYLFAEDHPPAGFREKVMVVADSGETVGGLPQCVTRRLPGNDKRLGFN